MSDPRAPVARRDLAALCAALAAHALMFVFISRSETRTLWERAERPPVEFEIIEVTPPPPDEPLPLDIPLDIPPEPPPPEPPPPEKKPEVAPPPPDSAPPPPDVPPEPPPALQEPEVLPPTGESLMRLPKPSSDSQMGKLLGTRDPLAASLDTLESSLDIRADKPTSDSKRAARNATKHLLSDLADDEVSAGLADDYFRQLRNRVETNWRPEMKQLNDGGESVTQIGMMKSFVDDRSAWDEMWRAYMDMAKLYAQGQRPKLEAKRVERLRELMRSRKGMFRFHAISELVLTQGPDGKVVTIDMPLTSGHPGIDEGAKDAIVTAVNAMVDAPPSRVHNGASFTSTWRMRATWTMVPPTAFLTGAGFDITPKGFTVDVPFDIKLKTAVALMRTDTHASESGDAKEDAPE